jgi:serine/threonine protein kinase
METLDTWEKYLHHLKKHCQNQVPGGPWELPDHHDPGDQDHNGNSKGNSSGSNEFSQGQYADSSGHPQAGPSGQSTSNSGSSRYVNHYSSNTNYRLNEARKLRDFCMHAQLGVQLPRDKISVASTRGPTSLIDICNRRIVQVPASAKYLALDYTMALSRCTHLKSFIETMRSSRTCPSLLKDVKDLLTQAITVTKDMGYQYLWIDIFCDLHMEEKKRSAIYAEATFIIFTRGHRPEDDSMNLLICHDRNLQTVRSWTEKTDAAVLFSHVQDLGRGSFGLVDKVKLTSDDNVQLTSTEEEFARKKFIKWKVGDPGRPAHLQEIESLQKFDHPNIARFVAAYIEEQSFNVVMLPVADCDLKRYLLQPTRWPEKLDKISKWYISLASAVRYLHEKCCRHGDLKPENILMVGDDVSITDLGFAQSTRTRDLTTPKRTMMTPKYCAPGTFKGRTSTHKSDIFSLGCVFLEIITIQFGRTLKDFNDFILKYSTYAEQYVIYCKHINSMQMWLRGFEECKPSAYQRTVIKLCIRMLDPEPRERPSAADICSVLEEQQKQSSVALIRTQPTQPLVPTMLDSPNVRSPLPGNILDIVTRSCEDRWTSIDFWPPTKRDIDLAELVMEKLCASVIAHGNKFPEQLDSLKTVVRSFIKPGLLLEDKLARPRALLNLFLFGSATDSADTLQVQFTPGHNAQQKWEHALRSVKHITRTTKRLSALKSALKPMNTTSIVEELEEQVTQSLDALDLKTNRMAIAFARSTRNCLPNFQARVCPKTHTERRKRAMSKTIYDNLPVPAKKTNTSKVTIKWDGDQLPPNSTLTLFTQAFLTFE